LSGKPPIFDRKECFVILFTAKYKYKVYFTQISHNPYMKFLRFAKVIDGDIAFEKWIHNTKNLEKNFLYHR
jgi:hypothetical protein